MLLTIFTKQGFSSPELDELIEELRNRKVGYIIEEIPTDISTNDIVADAQYTSILEIIRSSTGGKSVIFIDGLSDELIGFIIGHTMTANTPYIIGEKQNEVREIIDMIELPFLVPSEDIKQTVELIKKTIELNSCSYKKFKQTLSQLNYTGKLVDFILDGLMAFLGYKPGLHSSDTKFINSLLKSKELC